MAINVQTISNVPINRHIQEIMLNNYGLPEFQRTFVWSDGKVKSLWESLYEGYPVGQFLIWSPKEIDFPMRQIGRRQRDITNSNLCVIDGQQRLTAIYLVLIGEINLSFNLKTQKFVLNPKETDYVVKLDILKNRTFDEASKKNNFFYNANENQKDKFSDILNKLNNIYTATLLPYQIVTNADYDIVVSIFRKLNEQGVKLSEGQIALATISTKWKGVFRRTFNLLNLINKDLNYEQSIRTELDGYESLEEPDLIIRAWTAVHTGQHRIKYLAPESESSKYFSSSNEDSYEKSWKILENGFNLTQKLMSTKFDLTNYQFIKGYYSIVVLVNYFSKHLNCSEIDENKIAKWFIHSIIQGRYSNKSETKLREDIRATNEDKALNELFTHKYSLNPDNIIIEEKDILEAGFYSSFSTLLYILYRNLGTLDFYEDIKIGDILENNISWEYHHIFPKENFKGKFQEIDNQIEDIEDNGDEEQLKLLNNKKEELNKAIFSMANLTFLTPPTNGSILDSKPSVYLGNIYKTRGEDMLKKHFIPIDKELWKFNNFDEFRKERAKLILSAINEILKIKNLI
jgi:hypothetical protein